MSKIRYLTCIVCPKGCQLKVELDENNGITAISGNSCNRGITYAKDECIHPRRTVTSTVRCENGAIVAVKTSMTVPKEQVFRVMEEINAARPAAEVKIGDVIIANVAGTGADVVATSCGTHS